MTALANTMTVLDVRPHLLAFYDGRIPGYRAHGDAPNWLDDGAISLGICSYALIDGKEALVYDTHTSLAHARRIRETLSARGVERIRVVLSHWHLDHVAGNEAFADCEIIAHEWTLEAMRRHKDAIESGAYDGPPAICPLVPPATTYAGRLTLRVGAIEVELRHADIHSRDATVLYLPRERLLLAGDTLEDTVTYVAEPESLQNHLRDLAGMARWDIARILPNHGGRERIAAGGYAPSLIEATERYVRRLLKCPEDLRLAGQGLRQFVEEELEAGWIDYFEPYERVHRRNVDALSAVSG